MFTVGLLSEDKKLGSLDDQRSLIGAVDAELLPDDRPMLDETDRAGDVAGLRSGDCLAVAHARVLGAYKGGFKKRELLMIRLGATGVCIRVADGQPLACDTPEARAVLHQMAGLPTGRPSAAQKRNPGRPKDYTKPTGDNLKMALAFWASNASVDDVGKLVGEMTGTKKVSRATLNAWFGGRKELRQKMKTKDGEPTP